MTFLGGCKWGLLTSWQLQRVVDCAGVQRGMRVGIANDVAVAKSKEFLTV